MKLEVIKTYILAILVGISLILSYSLWNYNPDKETLEEEQLLDPNELDLGGTTETRNSLVVPSQMIFSKYENNYFSFSNPEESTKLFKDMTSWVLYNFRITEANGRPNVTQGYLVELIFPEALPMDVIPYFFTVNNPDEFLVPENGSFERVYVTFNESEQSMTFSFLSVDGKTQLRADVNNAQKYDLLYSTISNLTDLEEYTMLESEDYPIFVPIEPSNLMKYDLRIKKLPYSVLKNALFLDPSAVIENVTADQTLWYQDGPRSMQVFNQESSIRSMEFIYAQATRNPMTAIEILDKSISEINGFNGWPNQYHLENIDTLYNDIQYLMYYKGYPVFHPDNVTMIEQRLTSTEIIEHRQPLFSISYVVEGEEYRIPSGKKLINWLKGEDSIYSLADIQDIKIGYRLTPLSDIAISLTPAWYVKVHDRWQQVNLDDNLPRKE